MQFLEQVVDICTEEYAPVWNIVGIVINVIMIGIPILLIVLAMIDFAKAVIANKEDEQKKATKLLGKRFLYAIGVFASVWIVTTVLGVISGIFSKQDEFQYDEAAWKRCWSLIRTGSLPTKSCYVCSKESAGNKYKWLLDKDAPKKCTLDSKYTTESSCLSNNDKKCYECTIKGVTSYIWAEKPSASTCYEKSKYKVESSCKKNNKKSEDDIVAPGGNTFESQ